jgi:hypothetical protein
MISVAPSLLRDKTIKEKVGSLHDVPGSNRFHEICLITYNKITILMRSQNKFLLKFYTVTQIHFMWIEILVVN